MTADLIWSETYNTKGILCLRFGETFWGDPIPNDRSFVWRLMLDDDRGEH